MRVNLPLWALAATVSAVAAWAQAPGIQDQPDRLVLCNERLTLTLSKPEKGAIVSLVDTATGREMIAAGASPRLFHLTFGEQADLARKQVTISSREAATFACEVRADGAKSITTLRFGGLGGRGIEATCTAAVAGGDPYVRWRLSVRLPEKLVLERVDFPLVVLRAPLTEGVPGEAAVVGATKGGVYPRPSQWQQETGVWRGMPGSLAAQFAAICDATGGFLTACQDSRGYPKTIGLRRGPEGLEVNWTRACFTSQRWSLDYDVVQTVFRSPDPARPTDWRDAADLYKQWAVQQPWCARSYAQRRDIPAWMKAGPAMVRFNRAWLASPERLRKWLDEYWGKYFPGQRPLIIAYWGWEKVQTWITPDYFPVFPSDEQFARLQQFGRARNGHAFFWPSGYHYTLTYNRKPDGSFQWDDRQRFDQIARPHAVVTRDGKVYQGERSWLAGGETSCLCPGDAWTIDWFNDTAVECARRGVEIVQVDQVVGGSFPACYSTQHSHPPGPGLWQTQVFREQLKTTLAAMRKIQPQSVVCFEEPNELFLQEIGLQDYRDWEVLHIGGPPIEPASVFSYLYHEYVPTFQSNPREGNRLMAAYCLVNGQVPHFVPAAAFGAGSAPANGAFEDWIGDVPTGWDKVPGWQGKAFDGRCFRDDQARHSGRSSLRLENVQDSEIVQVSQNLPVGSLLVAGKRYRLSGWVKTDHLAQPNQIGFATLTAGLKATGGGGSIVFPAQAGDWTQGQAEFTVPEGSDFLRIMIHVQGPAKVWVDDMVLEEVLPDGTTHPATWPDTPPEHGLMKQWADLYHGAGRPYLMFGEMLHPPGLEVGGIQAQGHEWPAILHNAFRAPDGSEAVVMVNSSDQPQTGTLTWRGKPAEVVLGPWEVRLVNRP